MRKFYHWLVLPVAALSSSQARADNNTYAEIGNWSVTVTSHNTCYAVLVYSEVSMAVEYNAQNAHVILYLGNENATSVKDGQTIKLSLIFTRDEHTDDGWGEQEFTAHANEDGSRLFDSSGWFKPEMLDDIAKNDYFMALYNGKLVSGAKLNNSAAVVAQLRECSVKAANLNPKDPFLP